MNADGARVAWELLGAPAWPPAGVKHRTLADGTPSWTVRVRNQAFGAREFSYRVVLVPPPADQPRGWPVVGTVLHGSSGLSRGTKLPARERAVER